MTAVKTEGVVAGVGPAGERSAAASHVHQGRNKRKGRPPPSGLGSRSQRRGKRARQAVDDDVVLLEPDDLPASSPATAGRKADVGKGAKVTVKSERVVPNI